VINIGAGGTTYLNEVVEHACQITGRAVIIRPTSARSGDILVICADPASARRLLGWASTTDLLTGVSAQLKWLTSNRNGAPLAAESA
jgi:UDP-glucose 4-epimerase